MIALNFSKSTAMLFVKIGRRISKPRLVQLFGKPINWADTACYLGMTLNKRLTWSLHIAYVKKNAAQRLGMFGTFLSMRSGPSVRNEVLLYKQLMRPMMNYTYPIWRFAAHTHGRKLLVLQSKCLCIDTGARWCTGNRQFRKNLGLPTFADHIRARTESYD